ncbi:O-antigen ligase family protein [uncultured Bacteroides sp.]|uniref:O-antigen ligase family protein n=1 Tax=uncultured Bacteroides sp. TaxID=162156 RepID=UPI00280B1FB2|nr:O-antigen ligase family protein [uncultured Bacteroides sp.]
MEFILEITIFLIIIFSFIKLKVGVAIYLAYLMLVPYMQIHFGGVIFSYNLVNIIFLIAFFIDFRIRHKYPIDYKPFIPFIILYVGYLVIMLFSNETPLSYMLNTYRLHIMKIFILAFVMWNVILNDNSSLNLFRNVCLGCIAIASIYGLFLTQTEGLNPYIMELSNINGEEYNIEYLTRETGRMFGRITSVFVHPMSFGLFLGLSFIYICSCVKKVNIYTISILFILVLINVFTCGVRSVIAGLAISILFYLIFIRKFKIVVGSLIIMGIIYTIISNIPQMSDYVMSIVDKNSSNIGGSSLEMRITQFLSCFDIIQNNPLFGMGFDWHQFYMQSHISHPKLLCFESLVYVVLCNFGLMGALLWIIYSCKMFKYIRSLGKLNQILFPLSLFIFYVAYSCITGEYGYMQFFILFYIIMIGDIYIKNKSLTHYKKNYQ